MPRREHGELFQRFLPILERAFVGTSVEDAVATSQRYAVALHLRTLDFIEGKNATDAAAFGRIVASASEKRDDLVDAARVLAEDITNSLEEVRLRDDECARLRDTAPVQTPEELENLARNAVRETVGE